MGFPLISPRMSLKIIYETCGEHDICKNGKADLRKKKICTIAISLYVCVLFNLCCLKYRFLALWLLSKTIQVTDVTEEVVDGLGLSLISITKPAYQTTSDDRTRPMNRNTNILLYLSLLTAPAWAQSFHSNCRCGQEVIRITVSAIHPTHYRIY